MRNITINELENDLSALKYQIISSKIADRLTQSFHFDTFFEQQLSAWKQMNVESRNRILKSLRSKYGSDDMTYAEFL